MFADNVTKLPLATYAKILGINPLHFAQVEFTPANARNTFTNCAGVVVQYAWQAADAVSREDVAQAILEAETLIENELGYRLLPAWEAEEWHPTVRPNDPRLFNLNNHDIRGFEQAVRADWGWAIAGGRRASSLVEAGAAIVYSDADNDGYAETATVTLTVDDGQEPQEIKLYYPGQAGDPRFELRPISVSISGTTATVTFRRELAVKIALQDAIAVYAVEGDDDDAFLTTVDAYRVYNDRSQPAELLWEFGDVCGCMEAGCTTCQFSVQTGCLMIRRRPRDSWLSYRPATWNEDNQAFDFGASVMHRQPDAVRLWYYAGLRDLNSPRPLVEMDRQWARAVAALATARLKRPICECSEKAFEFWQQDLAFNNGAEELSSYSLSPADLANPFGTRRGELEAWRRVTDEGAARARYAVAP